MSDACQEERRIGCLGAWTAVYLLVGTCWAEVTLWLILIHHRMCQLSLLTPKQTI